MATTKCFYCDGLVFQPPPCRMKSNLPWVRPSSLRLWRTPRASRARDGYFSDSGRPLNDRAKIVVFRHRLGRYPMKFTLTYDGSLPASANKPKNEDKWRIRKELAPQLKDLWAIIRP
jgi:hypothetical protein